MITENFILKMGDLNNNMSINNDLLERLFSEGKIDDLKMGYALSLNVFKSCLQEARLLAELGESVLCYDAFTRAKRALGNIAKYSLLTGEDRITFQHNIYQHAMAVARPILGSSN